MGSWFSSDDKRQEKALQKRDDEVRENDEHDMAEKGLPYDRLDELQVEAISYLKNRKLVQMIKTMELIVIEKKIAKKKRQEKENLQNTDYLGIANVQVFKDVKTIVAISNGVKQAKWVKEEVRLKWSDRFWLFFLKYYAKIMEGLIPFSRKHRIGLTGIPVGGNAIQMFFTPIVMVGIPKWIRCPPSVMYGLWWKWFTLTLTAYIPIWGTARFAARSPITAASSRLSTYLLLRKLLSDSHVLRKGDIGYDPRKKQVRSKHLNEYLGKEVTYPMSMDKDISGKWPSCCSCLW